MPTNMPQNANRGTLPPPQMVGPGRLQDMDPAARARLLRAMGVPAQGALQPSSPQVSSYQSQLGNMLTAADMAASRTTPGMPTPLTGGPPTSLGAPLSAAGWGEALGQYQSQSNYQPPPPFGYDPNQSWKPPQMPAAQPGTRQHPFFRVNGALPPRNPRPVAPSARQAMPYGVRG